MFRACPVLLTSVCCALTLSRLDAEMARDRERGVV